MKLKTLKDLGKTTIMVPDLNKRQPCTQPLIPKEHIQLNELRQEIIIHIKSFHNGCGKEWGGTGGKWNICKKDNNCTKCITKQAYVRPYLKYLFNITGKDLNDTTKTK